MMRPSVVRLIHSIRDCRNDLSFSAITVGIIATMVSFAGPLAIVFQAAEVAGLNSEQLSSWIWAISMGSGLTAIVLSILFKAPIITAWSTPGAVLLVTSLSGYSYSEAIGAYIISGLLITILGVSGLFAKWMNRIPQSIISAMLAGILLKFGVDVFLSMKESPLLVLPMILSFFMLKRISPSFTVIGTLIVGIMIALGLNQLHFENVQIVLSTPILALPSFSLEALIGLAIPLCVVTMASQNATGIGVLRSDGYQTPVSPLIGTTGFASLILAPFGSHGVNLAAITAAICTGKEAHPDPSKRYIAGISSGAMYLLFGSFGATITSLFMAFPKELLVVIAGLALFTSLSSSLSAAMEGKQRESALVTFLITISGISIAGIGSAFWGLLAGLLIFFIMSIPTRKQPLAVKNEKKDVVTWK